MKYFISLSEIILIDQLMCLFVKNFFSFIYEPKKVEEVGEITGKGARGGGLREGTPA